MQMLERRFFPVHRNIGPDTDRVFSILVRCMNQQDDCIDVLKCIFYDAKERCLVSTDGKVIVWVSADIPALACIRQYLGEEDMRLLFVRGSGLKGFVVDENSKYPNWKKPIPDYKKFEQAKHPFQAYGIMLNGEAASLMVEIGIPLNIRLLRKLKGFDWSVSFDSKNHNLPVVFNSINSDGNDLRAAVMPIRMDLVREGGLCERD